jgi:hypothetical protein
LPRGADFGFSLLSASPSSAVSLGFLERGLAGAFFGGGSGLPWSLMREERRGSAPAVLDLRTIQKCVRRKVLGVVVWFRERRAGHSGKRNLVDETLSSSPFLSRNSINRHSSHDPLNLFRSRDLQVFPLSLLCFIASLPVSSNLTQDTFGTGRIMTHPHYLKRESQDSPYYWVN